MRTAKNLPPIHRAASNPTLRLSEPETGRSETFPRGNETLLVVDDEEAVLDVTCEMLKKLGYRVLKAYNGAEAVELYRQNRERIDAVVLDLNMPVMDGEECMEKLLQIGPGLVILVATARLVARHKKRILAQGARGIIQKPFLFQDLAKALRSSLDQANRRPSSGDDILTN